MWCVHSSINLYPVYPMEESIYMFSLSLHSKHLTPNLSMESNTHFANI